MKKRSFWLQKIHTALLRRSVLWLSGVRRAGKTCLCQSLPESEYFDCELPRIRRMMDDPEGFLKGLNGRLVILDEVHRLTNPSELLKIAADHYPDIRIVATGPSTLGASAKFRDTLAGRKSELWLTPADAPRYYEDERLNDIRKHERTGRPLGKEGFVTCLESAIGRNLQKEKPGPQGKQN